MQKRRRRNVAPMPTEGLRNFFQRLVVPAFGSLGLMQEMLVGYVVDLLARFARTDQLYRIRDARGQQLETIAEMLIELNRQWESESRYSFDQDLEIRRHCGDYALFMSGLFRAYVERQGLLDYYLQQGGMAYRSVADMEQLVATPEARLFQTLAENFEHMSGALDYMRKVYMRPELHSGPYGELLRDMEQY